MTPAEQRFRAVIEQHRGGGTVVEIPFDVHAAFGARGRVKVCATFDGHPYRGSIVPIGGRHLLGVLKSIREALGKSVGDSIDVVIELDTEVREVEVAPELAEALRANPAAAEFFDGLAYTYRKEYARWVAEARRPETRSRRLAQAIDKLGRGEKL